MNSGILTLDKCYEYFLIGILIFLSIMLILVLIKACMGPSVADRIVCINMMGTMVMVMIAVLAILLRGPLLSSQGPTQPSPGHPAS